MANHLFDGLMANARPEHDFARLPDGRTFTYQDVLDVSARFANLLVERGVKPGDRVAVQVPKSIEAVMLYLGAVRAGAVFLPLNTAYMPAEIEYFLGNATPAMFVCDPQGRRHLPAAGGQAGHQARNHGRLAASLVNQPARCPTPP